MLPKVFLVLSLPVLLLSCAGRDEDCSEFMRNTVDTNRIQQVICQHDSSQSYAIFLPGNYSPDRKWPLLLCFDPHADGLLPVRLFAGIAGELGYIVAGSNNSANGVSNIEYVVRTFYEDVTGRYSIDPLRIYAAGFSGGGRIATSLALSWSNIKGVITCGAGLPGFQPSMSDRPFAIAALAGDGDFNCSEVESLSEQLKGSRFNLYTGIFPGTHAWPPQGQLAMAFIFLHLKGMQEGIVPVDKRLIACLKSFLLDSIHYYQQMKNIALEFDWAERGISLFSGFRESKTFRKKVESLSASPEYLKFRVERDQIMHMEEMLRMEYRKAFTEKDTSWWKHEVGTLRSRLEESSDQLRKAMYERLLAYLSIMAYSYTNKSIQDGNKEAVLHFVSIYGIIDPQNPDYLNFRKKLSGKS